MKYSDYDLYLFDCDGVILDSNNIKSDSFYELSLPFGKEVAVDFLEYHKENGGISRFEKCRKLAEKVYGDQDIESLTLKLIDNYGDLVRTKLESCNLITGVESFLKKLSSNKCHVVSGGFQEELEYIFKLKKIDSYFSTINGSPRTKFQIVDEIGFKKENKVLFIGDSRLDYEVAANYSFDFLFVSEKSEFKNWQDYFLEKNIYHTQNFNEL
jgi:phosphoglycolate phosphatase-like HAD superfamily hydrolase